MQNMRGYALQGSQTPVAMTARPIQTAGAVLQSAHSYPAPAGGMSLSHSFVPPQEPLQTQPSLAPVQAQQVYLGNAPSRRGASPPPPGSLTPNISMSRLSPHMSDSASKPRLLQATATQPPLAHVASAGVRGRSVEAGSGKVPAPLGYSESYRGPPVAQHASGSYVPAATPPVPAAVPERRQPVMEQLGSSLHSQARQPSNPPPMSAARTRVKSPAPMPPTPDFKGGDALGSCDTPLQNSRSSAPEQLSSSATVPPRLQRECDEARGSSAALPPRYSRREDREEAQDGTSSRYQEKARESREQREQRHAERRQEKSQDKHRHADSDRHKPEHKSARSSQCERKLIEVNTYLTESKNENRDLRRQIAQLRDDAEAEASRTRRDLRQLQEQLEERDHEIARLRSIGDDSHEAKKKQLEARESNLDAQTRRLAEAEGDLPERERDVRRREAAQTEREAAVSQREAALAVREARLGEDQARVNQDQIRFAEECEEMRSDLEERRRRLDQEEARLRHHEEFIADREVQIHGKVQQTSQWTKKLEEREVQHLEACKEAAALRHIKTPGRAGKENGHVSKELEEQQEKLHDIKKHGWKQEIDMHE